MKLLLRSILLCCIASVVSAGTPEHTESVPPFGIVHLYYQTDSIGSVVLFISGDGGWNLGVVSMARSVAAMKNLVVGIDIRHYINHLNTFPGACCYPPGEFEYLSKFIQRKLQLSHYHTPVIIGYSSGATLAYTLIAQAPHGTFSGAISMGFCPDLPVVKPFCRENGLSWHMSADRKSMLFEPFRDLSTPWIAFQGQIDEVCAPSVVDSFVQRCGSARVVRLEKVGHGFSVEKNWLPQLRMSFDSLVTAHRAAVPSPPENTKVSDLPIIELPADSTSSDLFAVILSGDGGWAGIDRGIAEEFVNRGIPVAGLNSLQYLWTPRTPDGMAADLDRIINHYAHVWKKQHCLVIGYSLGADVLPFMASRLPKATTDHVILYSFLGLSSRTGFEFHLSEWINDTSSKDTEPVLPEIQKLKGRPMLYIYGTGERDNLAEKIDRSSVRVIAIDGGHHMGGAYARLADSILTVAGGH